MNRTVELHIELESHVLWARRIAGRIAQEIGFRGERLAEIDFCVKELAGGLAARPSPSGVMSFREISREGKPGVEIAIEEPAVLSTRDAGTEDFLRRLGALENVVDESDIYSSPPARRILLRKFLHPAAGEVMDEGCPLTDKGFKASVEIRTYPGADVCGDGHIIRDGEGRVLLAVLDGLGHGSEARKAASLAEIYLHENYRMPLEGLLGDLHRLLRTTRGVAAGLVRIESEGGELSFTGVGNISGRLWQPETRRWESLVSASGALGVVLRNQLLFSYRWAAGSILVMHSDGVSPDWELSSGERSLAPQDAARLIMKQNWRGSDDATVMVAK